MSLFSLVSFASNIDTVYFKPGDAGNIELKIDTVKYPYLTEDNVNWFIGFPEVTATFDQNRNPSDGNEVTATVCAVNISTSEIFSPMIITGPDNKKYLHSEKIGDNWFSMGSVPGPRTIVLFSAHQVVGTRTVDDYFGTWYDKADLANSICDTVAVLHIQKQLTGSDIRFTKPANEEVFYVGDTVVVTPVIRNDADSLDVNSLSLITVNEEDTILLDYCKGVDTLSFIPETDGKVKLEIGASNLFGNYVSTFSRTITILPTLELSSLQSTIVGSTETLTTTYEGVDSMTVSILEGDSLQLVVNTNSKEADIPVNYSWNVDGQGITADSVYVNKNTLSISKFKTELQGTYNCIITEKNSNKILATASFKVVRQSPTANEIISETAYQVTSENGSIVVKGASNKQIMITNMLGQVVYNGVSNSDNFSINVPNNKVLIIKVDNQTFKVLNK